MSHDTPFRLIVDRAGRLWAGTEDGVNAYDPKTERFQSFRIPELGPNRVRDIAEDSRGALWLATLYGGVHRFDPATGQFTVYRHSEAAGSLSSDAATAICVDHSGAVWAGTGNGLNRLDTASGKFTAWYEHWPTGSSGERRKGNRGRSARRSVGGYQQRPVAFRPRSRRLSELLSFGRGSRADLTPRSGWSRTGEMYLGSYSGLIRFFPDRVVASRYVPPVVLTGFQLADVPAKIGGESPLKQSISLTESL